MLRWVYFIVPELYLPAAVLYRSNKIMHPHPPLPLEILLMRFDVLNQCTPREHVQGLKWLTMLVFTCCSPVTPMWPLFGALSQ
jgi:hypothetical protein